MARYIDADLFLEKMKKTSRYFDIKFDIENMPTVDVVPKSEVAMNVISEFANMLKCHSFDITDAHGEVIKTVVIVKSIVEVEEELKKKYTEEKNEEK